MSAVAGKISTFTKIAYGFGLGAEGIKNNTFNVFLLIFYQQVVGLDIRLCGAALFITLMVDAIGDPLIGSWSDGLQSKWGRRLPFMFAAGLPLAGFFWCVLDPPQGMSQTEIFAWLVLFASATRFSMSLFSLPHQSLVAELTDDFGERVSLQNLRNVFGWVFGLLNVWLGFNVFLATTPEYPVGVLNPEGYRHMAVWGAIVLVACTFISTLGVRAAVLRIPPARRRTKSISIPEFPRAMLRAIGSSQSYRAALAGGLLMWMSFGMTENTRTYMSSYFWGLTSERIAVIIYVILGSVLVVLGAARPLARRMGKRRLGMYSMLLFALCEPIAMTLRLVGWLPANDNPALLPILCVFWFVGYTGIIMAMTIWGTMIADVADEYELRTGARQEGLLYSAGTFFAKIRHRRRRRICQRDPVLRKIPCTCGAWSDSRHDRYFWGALRIADGRSCIARRLLLFAIYTGWRQTRCSTGAVEGQARPLCARGTRERGGGNCRNGIVANRALTRKRGKA